MNFVKGIHTFKKEQQQILEIQSFPLSGTGEEQVPCMEFKPASLLRGPPVFGASTPKAGDSPLIQPCSKEL